jgi:hypothetical protein
MLEMIETVAEKANEERNWFRSVKESAATRQTKKEIREKEKKALAEENERFRSFINRSR